ncbi:MAG TPA: LPS export ABC transporter permease LptF [Gammaproteobacteria bacterium]|nr:LPS export ABC transporter permease LptF [Gammaproteobacteria bacterium]
MIISRYLTREVARTLLAVTLILLLAVLCQQIVRYLNYVATGKIATDVLLQLISFEIPYLLALLLPLGLYLGILLAYGRLYADNEMAILQMCGFGSAKLMRVTMGVTVIVCAAILVLMLWINPWLSAKRQQVMESDEATLHLIRTLIPGRFQVSPDGRYVMYVETLSRDHERAENVFLAQERKNPDDPNQPSWTLMRADEGYQIKDADSGEPFFVMADGYRYEGAPGQNDYKIIQFKKYAVRIPQDETRVIHDDEEALSTQALWQEYQEPLHAAEFQWRFSIAIAAFLLAMLAVPFSAIRPRHGRYLMFLPAILIYVVYFNLLFIARRWVEEGMVVSFGMWWVHGIMLLLIMAMMARRRRV